MKRFFVILLVLMLVGSAYADGPRYRFKSRRALQSLWRNEMSENAKNVRIGQGRKLSAKELQGENADKEKSSVYGVVVADPFSDSPTVGRGLFSTSGGFSSDPRTGTAGQIGGNGGKTTGGGGRPLIDLPEIDPPFDPTTGGTVDPNPGQPYAPPRSPVGDGLPCLLIFSAMLIAIKKRLSK